MNMRNEVVIVQGIKSTIYNLRHPPAMLKATTAPGLAIAVVLDPAGQYCGYWVAYTFVPDSVIV